MAAHFGPLALQLRSDAIDFYPPFTGSAFTRAGPSVADASFGLTTVDFLDLRQWSGLELARHATRSVITFDTLVCSQGRIPLPFLPGCGLPEKLIEYLPSLFQDPIQFYSCFISYSTMDQDFAARLYGDLQNKGVRCWFAPHDVRGGRKLHEQIDEAIRFYDRLLLILSEHSMNSEWVKTEIAHARQKELNDGRQVLFPIRLVSFAKIRDWKCFDADAGKDSAREIREYFIPDFSNWKDHDSYQAEFQRLVSDLKAEQPGPAEPANPG
ncbi:MAG: toll/interleukin-1 receptor domain-containing protein [Bryobacteraceae bacterium]